MKYEISDSILFKMSKGKVGNDIIEFNGLKIPQFSLTQIFDDIGYDNYNSLTNILSLTSERVFHEEKYDDMDFKNIDFYDLLISNEYLLSLFIDFLNTFIICDNVLCQSNEYILENNKPKVSFIVCNGKERTVISRDNYEEFRHFFRVLYQQPHPEDSDFNKTYDKLALKTLRKIARKKANPKYKSIYKSKYDLTSIINGLCVFNHIKKSEIYELTIYQIYELLYQSILKDNCDNFYLGLYMDKIDGKKVNLEDMKWYNKYK